MKIFRINLFLCLMVFVLSRILFSQQERTLEYRINPHDIIEVSVYEEPDLSKVIKVDLDGKINYPLLGSISVKDLTAREVEGKVTDLLARDYLVNPQVSVTVKESARISVLGKVARPGSYELKSSMTVLDAIIHAGGFNAESGALDVKVIRIKGDSRETIDIDVKGLIDNDNQQSNMVPLAAGDLIMVGGISQADAQIVLFGEVKKPGSFNYKNGMTVIEAVALAGGLTEMANADGTKIIREKDGKRQVIRIPLGAILKGRYGEKDINLEPNDTIVVPQSFF